MITIFGRPTTKKNSGRFFSRGKHKIVLPSKAYENYENIALIQLLTCRSRFSGSIKVCCRYYLPDRKWWPDLVGLLQATSDILQKAKIIEDDKYITSYDGSEIAGIDKKNPRVEIEIQIDERKFLGDK